MERPTMTRMTGPVEITTSNGAAVDEVLDCLRSSVTGPGLCSGCDLHFGSGVGSPDGLKYLADESVAELVKSVLEQHHIKTAELNS